MQMNRSLAVVKRSVGWLDLDNVICTLLLGTWQEVSAISWLICGWCRFKTAMLAARTWLFGVIVLCSSMFDHPYT